MRWGARTVARILAVAGLGLATTTTLLAGGFAPGVLAFVLWGAVPYGLLLVLTRVLANGCALKSASSTEPSPAT